MAATEPNAPISALTLVAQAVAERGDDVVLRAWLHFTVPFLQVAELLTHVEELTEKARAHGIEPSQLEDAVKLLGCLRATDDPHKAWLAAALIREHCQNRTNLFAATHQAYRELNL